MGQAAKLSDTSLYEDARAVIATFTHHYTRTKVNYFWDPMSRVALQEPYTMNRTDERYRATDITSASSF